MPPSKKGKGRMTCGCGAQVDVVRYVDGKKTCNRCKSRNLSGNFLRRMEGEIREYQRDILQKYNKDGSLNPNFEEVYGEGRNA